MKDKISIWSGEKVQLRAIEQSDWEYYLNFNQDSIQSRSVFRISPPMPSSAYQAEAERLSRTESEDGRALALAIERVSQPGMVGAVFVKNADSRSGSFEHGLAIDKQFQRMGYGHEASLLLLRFMFGERRYHKSIVTIYDFNEASLAMHRRLGYSPEGHLREQEFFGGTYCDVVIMGMLADEFFDRYPAIPLRRLP